MAVYKIPLSNTPQRFELSLAGNTYIMVVRWFSGLSLWVFSLLEAETEAILINDRPIVTGCDLLEQWAYLKLGGALVCFTSGDEDEPPALENLGTDANLYFVTD